MPQRVEIAPHYDLWMQGARFGTIVRTYEKDGKTIAVVKMDHPQVKNQQHIPLDDCKIV